VAGRSEAVKKVGGKHHPANLPAQKSSCAQIFLRFLRFLLYRKSKKEERSRNIAEQEYARRISVASL
jgi:hypothetical protein